jgi:hypothetical protein
MVPVRSQSLGDARGGLLAPHRGTVEQADRTGTADGLAEPDRVVLPLLCEADRHAVGDAVDLVAFGMANDHRCRSAPVYVFQDPSFGHVVVESV